MKITISGHAFRIREPYSAGTALSLAEAQALNALRAENIRNNLGKLWAKAELGKRPGQAELENFKTILEEYDLVYQFQEKLSDGEAPSSLELELETQARAELESEIRAKGLELTRFEYDNMLKTYLASPAMLSKAQASLAARQAKAIQVMQELIGQSEPGESD